MNTKKLTVVAMSVALVTPVLALLAPTGLTVNVDAGAGTVAFDWEDVADAVKYSVDVEGTVTYTYLNELLEEVEGTAEVELSFGTSDRTDGGDMIESDLTITFDELLAAIAAALPVPPVQILSLDPAEAKVKALAPGKGAGAQNNPFSDPPVPFSVTF
jgi:hypothetical protein